MGRPEKDLDINLAIDLLADGLSKKDVATLIGCTVPTLDSRIEDLKKEESALLAYDKCHYLDLIKVKERLVRGVTEDKVAEAPLSSIASAYNVFGKMEQLLQGKPTEIHGLMGYLMKLEKEDVQSKGIIDITPGGIEQCELEF